MLGLRNGRALAVGLRGVVELCLLEGFLRASCGGDGLLILALQRARIELGDWVRPVLTGGRCVLLLDPPVAAAAHTGGFGARPKPVNKWRVASREVVQAH